MYNFFYFMLVLADWLDDELGWVGHNHYGLSIHTGEYSCVVSAFTTVETLATETIWFTR